jgi:outer membrane lipoprotein-sorting protein
VANGQCELNDRHRVCRNIVAAEIAATALIAVLWVSLAAAHILPGPFVLELMAQKLSGAQSRRVEQVVVIEDPVVSEDPIELTEDLSFLLPGRFRSEILYQDSRRIHVFSQGQSVTIVDDRIVPDSEGRFDHYKDVLLYQSRNMLHKALLSRGVDVGIVSLGRMGDNIVYVIGAQYPDESASQLWVDKERLLPLRWIDVSPKGPYGGAPDRLDFIYSDWRQIDGTWYPMQIESWLNQQRIRTIHATSVEANVVIPGELMNVAYLRSLYKTPELPEPEAQRPMDAVDEVDQAIEDFKKKFEP